MKNEIIIFTFEEGNLIIRLLIAHFASDFIFQSKYLVDNKRWFSKQMLIHVAVVFLVTLIISNSIKISIYITILHWFIDALKVHFLNKNRKWEIKLFFIGQIIHLIVIVLVWALYLNIGIKLQEVIQQTFLNYKISLIVLAYVFVLYPAGYLIKYLTTSIAPFKKINTNGENSKSTEILYGGKLIGQFERLIILTLVLLNQYEAIGFLITGKSIIRFAEKEENLRSEYVLVGTMMSYAFAIITGVLVNHLLSL